MNKKPEFSSMTLKDLEALKEKLEGYLDENPMCHWAEEWLEEIESASFDMLESISITDAYYAPCSKQERQE
jgi:hypothetical protein